VPCDLQSHSFSHSDIPPSWSGGDCRGGLFDRAAGNRGTAFDFEFRVFGSPEKDAPATLHAVGRDEPLASIPHEDEETVEAVEVESLHQTASALVAAASAHRDRPAVFVTAGRRLDLYAAETACEVSD
jgi:hypothetical protein